MRNTMCRGPITRFLAPRQGVIEVQRFFFGSSYSARSVADHGGLGFIRLNDHDSTVPLVSAWEVQVERSGEPGGFGTAAWAVTPYGRVYTDGNDAGHYGDMAGTPLSQPIVGMLPTATGRGYWLVASDASTFAFGDAHLLDSTGSTRLHQPIVAMAATPTGKGYWLAAADGFLYPFGDAPFFGSLRGRRLHRQVVGLLPTPSGRGYWMVAADGRIFTFGDAVFKGSTESQVLRGPIVGMVPNGSGYTVVDESAGIYPFS